MNPTRKRSLRILPIMRIRNTAILLALLVGVIVLFPTGGSGAESTSAPRWQFSVKFLCGEVVGDFQEPVDVGADTDSEPVVPGLYETTINIHNPNPVTVTGPANIAPNTAGPDPVTDPSGAARFSTSFRKKVLVLYPRTGETPHIREVPQPPGRWFRPHNLAPDWGFHLGCDDIRLDLLRPPGNTDPRAFEDDAPFIEGYVVIEARSLLPLDVTVAYTGYNYKHEPTFGASRLTQEKAGFSSDVENVVIPKRVP
jgi:hypothetical protein